MNVTIFSFSFLVFHRIVSIICKCCKGNVDTVNNNIIIIIIIITIIIIIIQPLSMALLSYVMLAYRYPSLFNLPD